MLWRPSNWWPSSCTASSSQWLTLTRPWDAIEHGAACRNSPSISQSSDVADVRPHPGVVQNAPRLGEGAVGRGNERFVWLTWLITRLGVLCLLFGPESRVVGDVIYFTHSMQDVSIVGLAMTMREYPLPAVGAVALPWIMAIFLGAPTFFGPLVVLLGLGIDGLFTAVLTSTSGPGRRFALVVWLAAVPALGGLTYARFDLIPGVLVGCVVLLAG